MLSVSSLLIFVGVIFLLAGIYSLIADFWLDDRARVHARLEEEFEKNRNEKLQKVALFKDLGRVVGELTAKNNPKLSRLKRMEVWLEQSDLSLTVKHLFYYMAGAGVVLGLTAGLLRQSLLVGLITGIAGLGVPPFCVAYKRKMRLGKLHGQLAEAFETMSRVIRAGHTLPHAMRVVATECPKPLATEFSLCYERFHLGLSMEVAFQDLIRRIDTLETRLFVLAAQVQQQTGGNLTELLDKLAILVRERYRNRQKLQTLTAEGRLQAKVLAGIPIVLFFVMLSLKRDYAETLLDYPWLIAGTLGFQLLGMLWIRKIVNLET